ncbi:MAG: hypothetical protein LKE29_04670 [Acidaminococcaceae bacterium]|jgi:hypothetical protein|nr:hypothetical protein [Acidaminococcaceae bacterium]
MRKSGKILTLIMLVMLALPAAGSEAFSLGGIQINLPGSSSSNQPAGNRAPQELPDTTADCDLAWAGCYVAPKLQLKIQGRTMVIIGKDNTSYGKTDETGRLVIGIPAKYRQGIIWKSGADHYFTFDRDPKVGPVKLVRHEGTTNSIERKEFDY